MQFSTAGRLLVLGLATCATAQEVACWAPDGVTRADNETYVPCNKLGIQQADVYSMCCALDGPADERDICSASGLCTASGRGLTRAYCTDKTWKSKACLNICMDDNANGNSTGPSEMTACNDGTGSYCCGGNTQCCGTSRAVSIPAFQDSVCHNTSADEDEDAAALSTWRSATIGLAAALGVTLLAALASTVWMARQNKKLKKQLAARPDGPGGMMQHQQHYDGGAGGHTPSVSHAAQFQHQHYTGSTQQHHSPLPEHGHLYNKPSLGGGGGGTVSPPAMHSPQSDTFPGNVHRYSELDAAATARSEMASPPPDAGGLTNARGTSPRPDSYGHADPLH